QQTARFDLPTSALYKGNYFDLIAKRYRGFEVSESDFNAFREDIESNVLGISYLRFHNPEAIDIKAIKSGRLGKKSKGSLAYGGFFSYNNVKADSSMVPSQLDFSSESQIEVLRVGAAGLQVGYFYRLWLLNRVYLFAAAITGMGMNFGTVQAIDNSQPDFSPGIRLQAKAGAGYIKGRYSISFISDQSAYAMGLEGGSIYAYGIGSLKLSFTWRFYSENALHHILQKNMPRAR
ncbi:MAG: DUF4421 family protein, partial [Bacteroidota bacterium]